MALHNKCRTRAIYQPRLGSVFLALLLALLLLQNEGKVPWLSYIRQLKALAKLRLGLRLTVLKKILKSKHTGIKVQTAIIFPSYLLRNYLLFLDQWLCKEDWAGSTLNLIFVIFVLITTQSDLICRP